MTNRGDLLAGFDPLIVFLIVPEQPANDNEMCTPKIHSNTPRPMPMFAFGLRMVPPVTNRSAISSDNRGIPRLPAFLAKPIAACKCQMVRRNANEGLFAHPFIHMFAA